MAGTTINTSTIEERCLNLAKTLRSKNLSEKDIALRISRYKNFALDYMKKSVVISDNCTKNSVNLSRSPPRTPSSLTSTKKSVKVKSEPDDRNVSDRTSLCPKSPVKEAQSASFRADGDSGISSERKSPLGLISRGLSNDSTAHDSHPRKSASDQPRTDGSNTSKNEATRRQSRARESSRPNKRRSSSVSSSRSPSASHSRSRSRSRSKSEERSRSKRKGHKKHKKSKKRRKHHRRHNRRRSHSARSPSYSRYRSRSRSHSRRGRRRRHKRSRSRSLSANSSLSRSPSIRRRPGSPSHLDRRRITSARKRPVPYLRKSTSSGSGDVIEGGGIVNADQSGLRSRHSRSPSSEGFLRHRLNNLARRKRQLAASVSAAGHGWLLESSSSVPSLMSLPSASVPVTPNAGHAQH